ncbi:FeoB-associated Cys-rich membrane protein [Loigolactobacillus jiayinensis]|uniref:FeoB-associated Cys-rich membrane protein n=1 Tax=Loigolactobacillus jiayinensis TaxID=2486016 RepID=A0ABW1REX5_9LACO|nr:FeoB-associated Cys-rich membrane protein [Loigolactobacillus jiayinensis]
MSTVILAAVLLIAIIAIVYLRFFKKGANSSCHDCSDVGCPLADQANIMRNNNQKHA